MARQLEIGYVTGAHGLRGELVVRLHWPQSSALARAQRVTLDSAGQQREFAIRRASHAHGHVRVLLEGIDNRDDAELWGRSRALVDRADLGALESGEYYLADLVGAEVHGPSGLIGTVVRIATYPTVDALVVELLDGSHAEQPLLTESILGVDLPQRRVTLVNTEGLI